LLGKAQPPELDHEPEEIVSFGVKRLDNGLYQPTRFTMTMKGDKVTDLEETAIHDAVPYEPIAYEYLSVDVVEYYAAQTLNRARAKQ
jgi:hypothetical protein